MSKQKSLLSFFKKSDSAVNATPSPSTPSPAPSSAKKRDISNVVDLVDVNENGGSTLKKVKMNDAKSGERQVSIGNPFASAALDKAKEGGLLGTKLIGREIGTFY